MSHLSHPPLCPGCAEAQELLNRLSDVRANDAVSREDMQTQMPLLLETALSLLLSEFDPEARPFSNTGAAIQLIALGAEHAQALQTQ